jgi:hypothetical protein
MTIYNAILFEPEEISFTEREHTWRRKKNIRKYQQIILISRKLRQRSTLSTDPQIHGNLQHANFIF